jgi:hypothetical protein
MRRLACAVLAALALAGCPAAHSDYPTRSCKVQSDCYEGETCVLTGENGTCTSSDGGAL